MATKFRHIRHTFTPRRSKVQELVSSLVYTPNWRNRRFVVWTLAIPLALFGYFVPYCHLVRSVIQGSIGVSALCKL